MGLLHDNGEAYELWNGEVHPDSAQCFFEVELVVGATRTPTLEMTGCHHHEYPRQEQHNETGIHLQIHPVRRVQIRRARKPLRCESHPACVAVKHVSVEPDWYIS